MFCPKCNDVELEPVTQDKLEYLACVNGCGGVWVAKSTLENYWGKKKFKQMESLLEEAKQPEFGEELLDVEKGIDFEDELDEDEDEDLDFEDDEDEDEDEDYEEEEEEDEEEDEDDDDEVEEVDFSHQRGLRRTFVNDEGEYDDPVTETGEGYTETVDLIEEDDDESLPIEEEAVFLSSPVSGNPMKRYFFPLKDKVKCFIAMDADSENYWVDASEEVFAIVGENNGSPKNFAELLAYDRPEEEIFEEDEEDEDDEI